MKTQVVQYQTTMSKYVCRLDESHYDDPYAIDESLMRLIEDRATHNRNSGYVSPPPPSSSDDSHVDKSSPRRDRTKSDISRKWSVARRNSHRVPKGTHI